MRRRSTRKSCRSAAVTSIPSKSTVPEVGSISRRILRPVVVLPLPLSPDQPQRFAARDREAHAVHRLHRTHHAREDALAHGEVLDEILDQEEIVAHGAKASSGIPAGRPCACIVGASCSQQATP